MSVLTGKKIILVVAHSGYQHIEYNVPKKMLTIAGAQIITASNQPGQATAKDGSSTPVDIVIDKINVTDYSGIFLIGGPGALECLDTGTTQHLITQAHKHNIPHGAICISVRILAKAGVLKGKKATGWDGDHALRSILEGNDAIYEEGKPVVTDGIVATATGPESAEQFGEAIIRVVTKHILAP